MKVIKIEKCDQCPYCNFYDGWYDHDDVDVCDHREVILEDPDIIDSGCTLEDQK